MITRIMMIGAGRMYEAACALSFDHHLYPSIDQTIIVSPYSFVTLTNEFHNFGIDTSNFKFFNDQELVEQFDLQSWVHNHWYLQQGIKLNLIDSIDSDFLIQDCDVFAIKPYCYFINNRPNFRVEELWNDYQCIYENKVTQLLGISRVLPYSFVTEFMPYLKEDWLHCKKDIENKHNKTWQDAIQTIDSFDDSKWLSEYEILGIFKTNKDKDYQLTIEKYPKLDTFEEFFMHDWTTIDTVKFKIQPFKYMGQSAARKIKDFFMKENNDFYSN